MRPILPLMNAQQQLSEDVNKVRSKVLRQLLWLNDELGEKATTFEKRELVALIRKRLKVSRATAYDYASTLLLLNRKKQYQRTERELRPTLK